MWRILLLFVLLAGCNRQRTQSADAGYESANRLMEQGALKQAAVEADSGLRKCGSSLEWCWKFRLLKAEILLASRQEESALQLLNISGEAPTTELQARRLMDQGQASFRRQDHPRASSLFAEALQRAEAGPSSLLVGEIELRQGALLERTRRFDEAEATLRRALDVAIRGGDLYLQANAMGNLGVLFTDTYRLDEAIYWLQRAYELFSRLGATNSAAKTVGNLANCYYRLGDVDKALDGFEQTAASYAKAGDKCSEQIWLGNSASVFLDRKDFRAAIDRGERALPLARDCSDKSFTAKWLNNLARANIGLGQLDTADRYVAESLGINRTLGDSGEELYDQITAARIAVERKQFDRARELFQSVANQASEDPTPSLEAREGLADLSVQTGDTAGARREFRSAIAAIESRQSGFTKEEYKLSYLSGLVRFYQSYVDFLVQQGETAAALEVAESSRARILTERAKSRMTMPRGFDVQALEALAKSTHRIFLSSWLAPKRSFVWAITPAKIELVELPPENAISRLVAAYRTAIEDLRDPIESHSPAGEQLSAALLKPLAGRVPAGSRITIVPDGALHSLNFETLPAWENPSKYWIEDVTLSVAPSLGLLLNSRNTRNAARPSLLAIGDPESAGQEYPRLPNARQEVEQIAALFPASNKAVYEGTESRPSCYRQAGPARFSLIHFAAHATANRASPLDSALILSREGNVYALSARDIMNVPLNADLVTLSSCRSAGARAYSGEGLVGLTWAFLQAGARRVIAGLWDVNDESTSMLMEKLYAGIAHSAAPEDALRAAKLSLVHGAYPFRKPYYWGPFQLYSGM